MGTNRNTIDHSAIIYPTQLLDKGIPLPFLEGKFVVDQGWCAVITEGGAFKEILEPGTHFLGKYKVFRDVKATKVDMRVKTLEVMTWGEFNISQPIPVEVDLSLSVEYRVADPRRVVTEVTTPLWSLFDRVIKAVRGSIIYATIDEIRTQGEGIARTTMENLMC
jgi:regulator of protease activity HflC (stomatin/prohibitin superfamily)